MLDLGCAAAMTKGSAWPQISPLAGTLLALGSVFFIVGVALYGLLPPELGLPAAEASYADALQQAAQQSAGMAGAGRVTFIGDLLVAAAALALVSRRGSDDSGLAHVGWSLIFVSFLPALVFDSLMGTALPNLVVSSPASFSAFKSWYDFQFASGNIAFGIGGAAIFYSDARASRPLLPRIVDYVAVTVAALAFVGGVGYVLGLFVGWQFNGPPLLLAGVALGALGIQIARRTS
jgi:hypothetical protein